MLGHEAVLRPVIGGGRDFAGQVTPIPFGEKTEPRLAADRPWPGRVIGPAPGVVYPTAREAEVRDDDGEIVTVNGRCVVSAAPARLAVPGEPPRRVTGWVGPWPLSERWWDPAAARRRGPVPASYGRRAGVAGGGPGWPVADRGGLLLRGARDRDHSGLG